ncbi:MAG: SlyX family protein [Planctomycetota bacterium]|jgi:uncharacterized coiled-coil protein SlyX
MPDRLTKLEEKITYLEHEVAQLDEVVRGMHDTLDAVRQEVAVLLEATRRQSRLAEAGPDEIPTDADPA